MCCGAHCIHRTKCTPVFVSEIILSRIILWLLLHRAYRKRAKKNNVHATYGLDSAILWRSILPHSFLASNSICDFATLLFNYTEPIKSELHHVNINNKIIAKKRWTFFPSFIIWRRITGFQCSARECGTWMNELATSVYLNGVSVWVGFSRSINLFIW